MDSYLHRRIMFVKFDTDGNSLWIVTYRVYQVTLEKLRALAMYNEYSVILDQIPVNCCIQTTECRSYNYYEIQRTDMDFDITYFMSVVITIP